MQKLLYIGGKHNIKDPQEHVTDELWERKKRSWVQSFMSGIRVYILWYAAKMGLDKQDIYAEKCLWRQFGEEWEEAGRVLRPWCISDPYEKEQEGRKF